MRSAAGRRPASFLAMCLVLAACQSHSSAGPSGTSSAPVAASRPPVRSGEPSAAPSPGTRPAVPDGFPVPSGAAPVTIDEGDAGLLAAWESDEAGPDVFSFYVEALPSAGFEVIGEFPGGAAAIVRFRAGEDVLDVSLTGDLDRTRIQLRIADESSAALLVGGQSRDARAGGARQLRRHGPEHGVG